jgi:hypothetical protein
MAATAEKKVRVKMLTSIAGTPSYRDGQVVDLEARIADAWLKEDMCELVRDDANERTAKA